MLVMMPGMDFFVAEPLLVMVRFGKWDELLAEPRPAAKYHTLTGAWLHAHGWRSPRTGKLDEAKAKDDSELRRRCRERFPPTWLATINSATGHRRHRRGGLLEATLAEAEQGSEGTRAMAAAVALEDKLAYDEPPTGSTRAHYLGAALLDAGKAENR